MNKDMEKRLEDIFNEGARLKKEGNDKLMEFIHECIKANGGNIEFDHTMEFKVLATDMEETFDGIEIFKDDVYLYRTFFSDYTGKVEHLRYSLHQLYGNVVEKVCLKMLVIDEKTGK